MIEKLHQYKEELEKASAKTSEEIELLRVRFLGQKGVLKELFGVFKTVPNEHKKEFGKQLNELKNLAQEKINQLKTSTSTIEVAHGAAEDLTLPGNFKELGSRHPISLVRQEIIDIFAGIGFSISEGPEVEDDWHNFTALNFPEEHPARDMQDTFFVQRNPDWALRTHTSSVQVRAMENVTPPIRTISPGRVFRNEAISSRSHCVFHQIEGLYIDKDVSFADLKQVLMYFAQEFFGKAKIRMRPSYFPFTEPSAEVDVYWGLENEIDHKITKGTGWLEVMGCGMVDPNVLKANGIDPEIYTGYAFGMGIERIAMNRYQIPDIRLFTENDKRFLTQFKTGL